jgi:DNA-binding NarL/FixJ family response regulator
MAEIKVMIADDHDIFREGLKSLLEKRPHYTLVAEANNGLSLMELFAMHRPDVLVLDLSMPDHQGVSAIPELLTLHPDCAIIILSMHCLKPLIQAAIKFGAKGYLEKENTFGELHLAIESALSGHLYLSDGAKALLGEEIQKPSKCDDDLPSLNLLSPREVEVFKMLADGYPTKGVAGQLGLSAKTVESHRANIMQKLCCYSVVEMTKLAIREGLIQA